MWLIYWKIDRLLYWLCIPKLDHFEEHFIQTFKKMGYPVTKYRQISPFIKSETWIECLVFKLLLLSSIWYTGYYYYLVSGIQYLQNYWLDLNCSMCANIPGSNVRLGFAKLFYCQGQPFGHLHRGFEGGIQPWVLGVVRQSFPFFSLISIEELGSSIVV